MTGDSQWHGEQRVLIAGAGVGGIEAALALNDLGGEHVDPHLYDARREFVYRPFAVAEPYGAARAFRYELRRLGERCGAAFHQDGIAAVDPERRLAISRDGEQLRYDRLIVSTGARMLWAVPGAVTFWGVADEGQVAEVIAELRAGVLERLVFTMPGGPNWALPLYELALLAATERGRRLSGETRITVVTPEDAPLEVFGRRAAEQMSAFLAERGVEVIAGAHPVRFEGGRLRIAPGGMVDADAVVSLPRLQGRRVRGIPHDRDGFVPTDEHGRVCGLDDVYAVGDVTSFPVKQGGIAAQQADAAAEAIVAGAGADLVPRPFDPVLRGVLWTGGEPRYLHGRPTGGHGEASGLSKRPPGGLRGGKVTARYLSPFVDSIEAEVGEAGRAVASVRSA
jgi:sulfide:quinone oxidoreductase